MNSRRPVNSNVMPTPSSQMRIEFQFTLAEWIEWKRANVSKPRLVLLSIAETSVIPLAILLGLTAVLVWLRFAPGWLVIAILAVIALDQIYLSTVPSRFRKGTLKKEWLNEIANRTYTVQLNDNGFDYFSADSSYKPTWNEIASVYQTKRLLMFCDSDTYVLLIPKHAFGSKQRLDEFLELAYQKTVSKRQTAPEIAASA
jgi:hypothetical protein